MNNNTKMVTQIAQSVCNKIVVMANSVKTSIPTTMSDNVQTTEFTGNKKSQGHPPSSNRNPSRKRHHQSKREAREEGTKAREREDDWCSMHGSLAQHRWGRQRWRHIERTHINNNRRIEWGWEDCNRSTPTIRWPSTVGAWSPRGWTRGGKSARWWSWKFRYWYRSAPVGGTIERRGKQWQ